MKEYFLFNSTVVIEAGLTFVNEHGYDIAAWVFFAIFFSLGLVAVVFRALRLFKLEQPGGMCFVFGPFMIGCSYLWFAEKEMVMQITEHTQVNMIFPLVLLFMWYLTVVWTGIMSHKPSRRNKIDWAVIYILRGACAVLYVGALCQTVGKYGNFAVCMLTIACCLCRLYATNSRTLVGRVCNTLLDQNLPQGFAANQRPLGSADSTLPTREEQQAVFWWFTAALCFTPLYMFTLLISHAYIGLLSAAGLVIFSGLLFCASLVYLLFIFVIHTHTPEYIEAGGDKGLPHGV